MANLTLESNLARPLGTPRPEPGHHVVVYKETGEGRVYYQTLSSGEVFRPPLSDRLFGSFVAYAVRAGMSLRHSFNAQLVTGLGEVHDVFKLHLTLHFRVSDPAALVERLSDDPLGSLEHEIRGVLRRNASELRYEELIKPGFELESYLFGGRELAVGSRGDESVERFRSFAQDFGIELDRIELTRTYSAMKIGTGRRKVEVGYVSGAEVANVRGRQQVELAPDQDLDLTDALPDPVIDPPDKDPRLSAEPAPSPAGRRVNAWFEGEPPILPLAVGAQYPFHLQVGAPRALGEAATTAPFVEPDWAGHDSMELLVSLFGEDFRIRPRQHRFSMPRLGDSPILTSRCTPLREGRCRLRIVISLPRELEVLQRLHVEIPAVTPAAAIWEAG